MCLSTLWNVTSPHPDPPPTLPECQTPPPTLPDPTHPPTLPCSSHAHPCMGTAWLLEGVCPMQFPCGSAELLVSHKSTRSNLCANTGKEKFFGHKMPHSVRAIRTESTRLWAENFVGRSRSVRWSWYHGAGIMQATCTGPDMGCTWPSSCSICCSIITELNRNLKTSDKN